MLDGVLALGNAYGWLQQRDESIALLNRAKEGYNRLPEKHSAISMLNAFRLVHQMNRMSQQIAQYRLLLAITKVSLLDDKVSVSIADQLENRLMELKPKEPGEAKECVLFTFEVKGRMLGKEGHPRIDAQPGGRPLFTP